MNTATLYAPHHSHGTVVGVVTHPTHLDSMLGEFVRTGVDVALYETTDREGNPMTVWAQSNNGAVRLVAEYV